jgi:hypothetical protein
VTSALVGLTIATTGATLGPVAAASAVDGPCSTADNTVTCTYTATGAEQSFVVPTGVTSLSVVAVGAPGASSFEDFSGHTALGGRGGTASADLAVTPGTELFIEVGGLASNPGSCYPLAQCVGGFNGGGSSHFGGGGGGASDVRTVSNVAAGTLESRLLVAAGGGGGGEGFDSFGGDGGDAGQAGHAAAGNQNVSGSPGGGAGTPSAGGSPGGALGSGGAGGGDTGGGGGGGLYGGGGGANLGLDPTPPDYPLLGAGGGGGGSSYAPGGTTGLADLGQAPSVTISYDIVPPSITADLSSDAPANGAGWYHTPVTVTFTCDAGTSALTAPCPDPVVLDLDGADQTVTRDIASEDGGTDSVTVTGIDIDQTAPGVTIAGLHDGARYLASLPQGTCVATDSGSGPDTCAVTGTSQETGRAWTYDYTASALDLAGNAAEATGTVTVLKAGVAKSTSVKGVWAVATKRSYDLVVVGPSRVRLVGVAPGNAQPSGPHRPFTRSGSVLGSKRWVTSVRITAAMAEHPVWTYTVKIGAVRQTIKVRVTD